MCCEDMGHSSDSLLTLKKLVLTVQNSHISLKNVKSVVTVVQTQIFALIEDRNNIEINFNIVSV